MNERKAAADRLAQYIVSNDLTPASFGAEYFRTIRAIIADPQTPEQVREDARRFRHNGAMVVSRIRKAA